MERDKTENTESLLQSLTPLFLASETEEDEASSEHPRT